MPNKRHAWKVLAAAALIAAPLRPALAQTKGFPQIPDKGPSRVTNPSPAAPAHDTRESVTPGKTTVPSQLKGPHVDGPGLTPRMEEDLRDRTEKGIRTLPGAKPLSAIPSIRSFSAMTNQCVSPDPNRPILSYRVSAPPGAAGIRRVRLNALHADGDRIRLVQDRIAPPGNPWPEVAESGVRDPEPAPDVHAYVLVVTDAAGRSVSRRLVYRYARPLRFDFLDRTAARVPGTADLRARALLENAGSSRWEYTDAGGTHRNTGVRASPAEAGAGVYDLRWGPYVAGTSRSQTFAITFEPASRACGEIPVTRTISWISGAPGGPVLPAGRAGGGSSGCDDPREGTTCSVRPAECVGRAADWTVSGRYRCVSGEVRCVAERNRDYCTACGGICGGCAGNSCSETSLCAPGAVCRAEHPPGGTAYRCFPIRDTSVPVRVACTPIRGFCWKPEEVGSVYNCQEAVDNPDGFREMAPPWGYAEPGGGS